MLEAARGERRRSRRRSCSISASLRCSSTVPERGFSYATDAPLDMRMDPSGELTAADLVNEAPERELANIFKRYGEERYARQIARAIVRRRPIATTFELVDVDQVRDSRARALRRRTSREACLPGAADRRQRRAGRARACAAGGARDAASGRTSRGDQLPLARGPHREAVHARRASAGARARPTSPICVCGNEPILRALSRRPLRPTDDEVAHNPRAASAKLRVAVKVELGKAEGLMASWSAAVAYTEAPPIEQGRRPRTRARCAGAIRCAAASCGSSSSAVLLAGLVALNVAVLAAERSPRPALARPRVAAGRERGARVAVLEREGVAAHPGARAGSGSASCPPKQTTYVELRKR